MSEIYEWTDETVSAEINNQELQHLYYGIAGFSRWENVLSDKKNNCWTCCKFS